MHQPSKVKLDHVLTKAVSHFSHFKPLVNDHLRSALKMKLWRMGKALLRLNSRQRKIQEEKWKQHDWVLELKPSEVRSSLLQENRILKQKLEQKDFEMASSANQTLKVQQTISRSQNENENEPRKRKARNQGVCHISLE